MNFDPQAPFNLPLPNILDVSRGNSSKANHDSATKHFNFFYKEIFKKSNPSVRDDLTLDNIKVEEVTDDLIGTYISYLGEAKPLKNKNSSSDKMLKYTTTAIYMSDLKTFLTTKFRTVHMPLVLGEKQWKLYCTALQTVKTRQAIELNEPLFGEYTKASDEDLRALCALVYWDGSVHNTEFLSMFLSTVYNCGRGSEVSICFFKNRFFTIIFH